MLAVHILVHVQQVRVDERLFSISMKNCRFFIFTGLSRPYGKDEKCCCRKDLNLGKATACTVGIQIFLVPRFFIQRKLFADTLLKATGVTFEQL